MTEPTLFSTKNPDAPEHLDLKTLQAGQDVRGTYAVREREMKRKKNGEPWIRLVLGDATGLVEAVCWDYTEAAFESCAPGNVLSVDGSYEVHERWGSKIKISSLREAKAGEYDQDRLAPSSPFDVEAMEADLAELFEAVEADDLRGLLEEFIGPAGELWARYREAPAAKVNHQAYRYGLLEHSVSVAKAVAAAALIFPGVDREVAVAGALLHDLGKLWAYTDDPLAIDLTDAGKLEGEIPLGYFTVRRKMEEKPELDTARTRAVLHIILSHHGLLEHGSPVTPQTREAVLVHFMDNLGGRLGTFDRIERELPDGEEWSAYDRALKGSAYFAHRDGS